MEHDHRLLRRLLDFKEVAWVNWSAKYGNSQVEAAWRQCWRLICECAASTTTTPPVNDEMGVITALKRHHEDFMSRPRELRLSQRLLGMDECWLVHCVQIYALMNIDWGSETFTQNWRDSQIWTTQHVHEILTLVPALRANYEALLKPIIIKQEELKYYSTEMESPGRPRFALPRDSVEPMTMAGLRSTDELHHGRLRMTDEVLQDYVKQEFTHQLANEATWESPSRPPHASQSSGFKPESEEAAWESPSWLQQGSESPRIKMEPGEDSRLPVTTAATSSPKHPFKQHILSHCAQGRFNLVECIEPECSQKFRKARSFWCHVKFLRSGIWADRMDKGMLICPLWICTWTVGTSTDNFEAFSEHVQRRHPHYISYKGQWAWRLIADFTG